MLKTEKVQISCKELLESETTLPKFVLAKFGQRYDCGCFEITVVKVKKNCQGCGKNLNICSVQSIKTKT